MQSVSRCWLPTERGGDALAAAPAVQNAHCCCRWWGCRCPAAHLQGVLQPSAGPAALQPGAGCPPKPNPATTAAAHCSVNQEVPSRTTPSLWDSQLARKSTEHQHQAHYAGCSSAWRRHRRSGSTQQQLPARSALGQPPAAAPAAVSGGSGGGARAAVAVRLLWGQGPAPLLGLAFQALVQLQPLEDVSILSAAAILALQARRAVCCRGRGAAGGAGCAGGGAPAPCPADRRLLRVHRRGARVAGGTPVVPLCPTATGAGLCQGTHTRRSLLPACMPACPTACLPAAHPPPRPPPPALPPPPSPPACPRRSTKPSMLAPWMLPPV